jgi:error-prone DNA polymerase
MDGRTVIQWNKDDLDELGILKVDCLALGMLTAIHKCFDLIEKHYGRRFTLATIPSDDRDVYAMICRADTMGVFQIESRAQMSMLPRLRPRCFYDLVIEVAIVRPGPIQGNMVHPYLRRRNGEEPITYPNDAIRQVLEKTLGVPLFQEQAMRLAVVAAGFTPGEADQLRRAMGAWRRPGIIDQFRKKLIDGMQAKGMPPEYADATFRQIRGFGDYGFPESHAASFALLVYVSAWLKCHYQAAFTTALLNSQPMGFYAPAQLVRNAREHGVEVLPPDVNHSQWESTLEDKESEFRAQSSGFQSNGPLQDSGASDQDLLFFENSLPREGRAERGRRKDGIDCHQEVVNSEHGTLKPHPNPSLRLGFHMLQGLSQAHAERIVQVRKSLGIFHSVDEFTRRTGLSRAVVTRLSKAGIFRSLGLNRREALWHALAQDQKKLPLFEACHRQDRENEVHSEPIKQEAKNSDDRTRMEGLEDTERTTVDLPKMSPAEEVLADYRTTGLSLSAHPMQFLREYLDRQGIVPAEKLTVLPNGRPVRVAGIVLVRQRPGTAKGITFVTLEDETGQANLIVRPDVWQRWRSVALGATILQANGRLQRHGMVIHVLTTKLINLTDQLKQLVTRSRNFC